jgi:hypothetical protein
MLDTGRHLEVLAKWQSAHEAHGMTSHKYSSITVLKQLPSEVSGID